jgi:Transposase C of IS166 homeodomain
MIMTEHIDPIPDDLPACQERLRAVLELLHRLERQLQDLERQLDETCATTSELKRSYDCLKEEYLALKRLLFGPRRERLLEAPGQQHLFDDDVPPTVPVELADTGEAEPRSTDPTAAEQPAGCKQRKGHGRRPIPDHLPRTIVPHDVPPRRGSATAVAIRC